MAITNTVKKTIKSGRDYKLAVALSTLSLGFGLLREFIVLALLGLTELNDELQLYLSIYYTLGLSMDAVRLSTLNLVEYFTPIKIYALISLVMLPIALIEGAFLISQLKNPNYITGCIAVLGSFLNILVGSCITYKQRSGKFLFAQAVNVIPNFILIPGVLACYFFTLEHFSQAFIMLCAAVPVIQLSLLGFIKNEKPIKKHDIKYLKALSMILRHTLTMFGEQIFQLVSRVISLKSGQGLLTVYAITVRTYAAAKYVLVDTYIGHKLHTWSAMSKDNNRLFSINKLCVMDFAVLGLSIISVLSINRLSLQWYALSLFLTLFFGFYYTLIVRILYYYINRNRHDSSLVLAYGLFDLVFALLAITFFKKNILDLLWAWYVLKMWLQSILLKRHSMIVCSEGLT